MRTLIATLLALPLLAACPPPEEGPTWEIEFDANEVNAGSVSGVWASGAGDIFVVGEQWGKVRALINDKGDRVKEAGPSVPVEVLGPEVRSAVRALRRASSRVPGARAPTTIGSASAMRRRAAVGSPVTACSRAISSLP